MSLAHQPALCPEAAHQNAFLQAVFRRSDTLLGIASPSDAGLAVYRSNASANAIRALTLMFPALHALLGAADFAQLARRHWLAVPPARGDWSQYGAHLGDWIAATNPGEVLAELPFLPDLARLDDALSRCQDAADALPDLATMALLEGDPSLLRMVLHPSVALLRTEYELVAFRESVLTAAPLTAPAQQASHVVLARQGLRAKACSVAAGSAAFVAGCVAGQTVLQAHHAALAAEGGFDVAAWLAQAISLQWVVRVEPCALNLAP